MLICSDQQTGLGCGHANPDGTPECERCRRSLANAIHLLVRGDVVAGRYLIVRIIGHGGFGKVYVAKDRQENRRHVALKETLESKDIEHFRVEFTTLRGLFHPHLPCYYDFVEENGLGYLVMEYVPGQSLEEALTAQGGPLPERLVLGYARQLCDALSYLHGQTRPISHRDIKPANVRLKLDGTVKLVDFGLLKQGTDTTSASRRGATLAYAPPEQLRTGGQRTGPRSDIYSLGATLYHLLTGCQPTSAFERIAQTPDPLVPPRKVNGQVSQRVSNAVVAAMSLQSESRPLSADRFRWLLTGTTAGDVWTWLRDLWSSLIPAQAAAGAPQSRQGVQGTKGTTQWPLIGLLVSAAAVVLAVGLFFSWIRSGSHTSTGTRVETAEVPTGAAPTLPSSPEATGAWTEPASGIRLVLVSAGDFLMGSTSTQVSAVEARCNALVGGCRNSSLPYELPQHTIHVEEIWIGKTEVTNAQYRAFVDSGGYADPSWWTQAGWLWRTLNGVTQPGCWNESRLNQPVYPVVCVSWYEAAAYARWLSVLTGHEFRLPTEAEWEKAARGDDGRTYPWGDGAANGLRANLCDALCTNPESDAGAYDGYELTAPVGSLLSGASTYGAQDMAGNVAEWTASEFRSYPYFPGDGRESVEGSAARVLRGGSFYHTADYARCAQRSANGPDFRDRSVGFRLASSGP